MNHSVIKHIRLVGLLIKLSLIRELQFRTDYISRQLMSFFWSGMRFVSIAILANKFAPIAGWSARELYILVLTAEIIRSLHTMFAKRSFDELSETIIWGKFDMYLTRPVSPLVYSTLAQFRFDRLVFIVLALPLLAWLAPALSFANLVLFIALGACSALMLYFIWLFFTSLNFHVGQLHDVSPLLDNLCDSAEYPFDVYRRFTPVLFVLVVPFLLIMTVPTSFLVNKVNPTLTIAYLVAAAIIIVGSHRFWHYSLKHYSSASA
jgi:ABC-2 type transport system permease protein